MCGIVGIIRKSGNGHSHSSTGVFRTLLTIDALRGEDSTGTFLVDSKNHVKTLKQAAPPSVFMSGSTYSDIEKHAVQDGVFWIGHNRKATQGDINSKNAHPFQYKNTVMVHNGKLENHTKYFSTDVDSEALCMYLDTHADKPDFGIGAIDGAFAIIWYNMEHGKLYIYRNHQRPLHYVEISSEIYYASEAELLAFIIAKHNLLQYNVIKPEIVEVKAKEIYSIDLKDVQIKLHHSVPFATAHIAGVGEYHYHPPYEYPSAQITHLPAPATVLSIPDASAPAVLLRNSKYRACFMPLDIGAPNAKGRITIKGAAWIPENKTFGTKVAYYTATKHEANELELHKVYVGEGKISQTTADMFLQTVHDSKYYSDADANSISQIELDYLYNKIMCETCQQVLDENSNPRKAVEEILIRQNLPVEFDPDVDITQEPTSFENYKYVCTTCVGGFIAQTLSPDRQKIIEELMTWGVN